MLNGPLSLIAELTHRCPLRCAYCSNPLELAARSEELSPEDWKSVLRQCAELGAVQASFTGGEPCLRPDLPELVAEAVKLGFYVNLITSGVGVKSELLARLVDAGVDHIQLSFQDSDAIGAKTIGGLDALEKKRAIAAEIRKLPVGFTVNLVIHRRNHSRLEEMMEMAVQMGATKIEVAHVQFNGWALVNRAALLPTLEQVKESRRILKRWSERLAGRVRVESAMPDYYANTPKPCMGGWAQKMILVDPKGKAAPCHSAGTLPGFEIPSVRTMSVKEIWFESALFNAFRGEEWMQDPCRSCDRRDLDHGGCRCQALALVGDASATDPVCHKSIHRSAVDAAILAIDDDAPIVPRGSGLDL